MQTDLFKNLCSHNMTTVEDDSELSAPFHLLQQGAGISSVQRELSDLQPYVVPGRGHDQLLESNQTCVKYANKKFFIKNSIILQQADPTDPRFPLETKENCIFIL